jgi:competence protein ComGC
MIQMVNQLKKQNLFALLMLILVIFVLGVLLGMNLNSSDIDEINKIIRNNELDTESYLIEQQLIGSLDADSCRLAKLRFEQISPELGELGRLLSVYGIEDKLGGDNFRFLKRKYHLLQIQTYLLIDKYLSTCNDTSMNIVLYYYDYTNSSLAQGLILDDLVKDYNINVFAVEYGFSRELTFLQHFYEISQEDLPALVVNRENVFKGLTPYEDIKTKIKIDFETQEINNSLNKSNNITN